LTLSCKKKYHKTLIRHIENTHTNIQTPKNDIKFTNHCRQHCIEPNPDIEIR
jgi:hypothetical protein